MTEEPTDQAGKQAGRATRRPSFATIVALLALVIAMGTTAQALPGRGSVRTDDLKNGAVTTPKIRNNAVTTPKIRNNAVSTPKLRNGAVTPSKIQDHALWALVRADGTLIQGAGVDAVNHPAAGIYQVRFVKSVTNRALTATIYSTGSGNGQVNVTHCDPAHPLGGTGLDPAFDVPECAFVNTEASDGTNTNNTFLVVAMPTSPGVTVSAPRTTVRRAPGETGR